ncbi:MAG: inositol monophosphatase [Candidatus Pacebacteria bacterium]|nr:inositol monophosphatase [Candidatus Paceibacterota bacterium]
MPNQTISRNIADIIAQNLPEICRLRAMRVMKEDGSYVTEGDVLCERLVADYVRTMPRDFELISEEMDLSAFTYDPTKSYIVLDPVDGTENFTSGLKEWGVSVSVYVAGAHTESMLLLPELGLQMVTGDEFVRRESRIHGLSSTLDKKYFLTLSDGREYRITGCCVFNMYNVISGSFATFENPKGARVWDILAGLNLALEHDLAVTVDGKPYTGEFLPDLSKKYRFKVEGKQGS